MLHYLDFAPRYQALARKIAEKVAKQATEVGSGRVGRTEKLTLEQKAELAARAYIRHRYTGHEDRMSPVEFVGLDEEARRDIRADAHGEVDEFLWEHRGAKWDEEEAIVRKGLASNCQSTVSTAQCLSRKLLTSDEMRL